MNERDTLYGVRNGQIYIPADGSVRRLLVLDCDTYASCGDVVVRDMATNAEFRIDAFKLAMVRYTLADNPLPEYFHLLLEASRASERVDRFDLQSDDPDSVTEFRKLQTESLHATVALLDYSTAHTEAIKRWLRGSVTDA